jgi:pyruvate dehydrogenase E2 component (dihydrolipoamide acetyltransferase)
MAHEVTMPQMGYDMTEGTINEWRVKEGDPVSRGDVIASIATDKADIDIEAYADGVLRRIVVQPGQTVPVGTVIAWIGEADEEVPAGGGSEPPAEAKPEAQPNGKLRAAQPESRTATRRERGAAVADEEEGAGEPEQAAAQARGGSPSGAAAGQPTEDRGTAGGGAPAEAPQDSAPPPKAAEEKGGGELAVPEPPSTAQPPPEGEAPSGNGRVKASPYARKRAAELGVDLAAVRGSGPGGRIVAQDVERALSEGAHKPGAPAKPAEARQGEAAPADAKPPEGKHAERAPAPVSADDDAYTDEEPSRLRRALARAMVEAKTTVPHFYLTVDVDAEPLLRLRAEVNELGPESPRLSVTDLIVRACALTLQSHRQLNAAWIDGRVRRFERSNVAVAVALADGLIAPTLRNLDGLSMRQLAERLHDLVARAKSNRLRQEELSGGHMAVSNLGMFGIEEFAAIITPPQSCVLAVGAVRDTAVVNDGSVKPGKRMRMTLAVDHRVTDGAQGADALARIKWLLEHPAALLV